MAETMGHAMGPILDEAEARLDALARAYLEAEEWEDLAGWPDGQTRWSVLLGTRERPIVVSQDDAVRLQSYIDGATTAEGNAWRRALAELDREEAQWLVRRGWTSRPDFLGFGARWQREGRREGKTRDHVFNPRDAVYLEKRIEQWDFPAEKAMASEAMDFDAAARGLTMFGRAMGRLRDNLARVRIIAAEQGLIGEDRMGAAFAAWMRERER